MKKISKVTVTGADDSVPPESLLAIAERHPFVEFGILVSRTQEGNTRFPSREWIGKLNAAVQRSDLKPNFAVHVCGFWVHEIFLGEIPPGIPEGLREIAQRWQLNTHGDYHEFRADDFHSAIRRLNDTGVEVIFQYDGQNTGALTGAVEAGLRVSALADLSHGAGVLAAEWNPIQDLNGAPLSCPWGFAGGLSPTNVTAEIEKMPGRSDGAPVWIDAETRLRSHENFDLLKVDAFLKAAAPYVIGVA